ncbi:hypothetical protein AVEN_212562-1 [Araneus ventricosus]|uniref:Transposase Tc1-like domain-containing protein n=1 Tax=Araneus ventricosus TaxID=182803 RepID=A0A4Y2Q6Q1_ARAVE|nr:hypothetical protein AVEN_212562-1 [Araneus ventricosus]
MRRSGVMCVNKTHKRQNGSILNLDIKPHMRDHYGPIHRLWNLYKREQNASIRRGSGRRRITTTANYRYLLQCARRRRTLTTRQLASQLDAAVGRPISRQTVSHRLHEGGLFARRHVVCVPLSPLHVRAWLHWARGHRS